MAITLHKIVVESAQKQTMNKKLWNEQKNTVEEFSYIAWNPTKNKLYGHFLLIFLIGKFIILIFLISLFNHTASFRRESDYPITTQYLSYPDEWFEDTYIVNVTEKNRYNAFIYILFSLGSGINYKLLYWHRC